MRLPLSGIVLLLLPSISSAQNKEIQDAVEHKLASIRYVRSLQDPATGGFAPAAPSASAKPTPSLRATSAAARALKYLTGKPAKEAVPQADKTAAFVLACFDPKTGGFADTPGGKPDVALTSVGVMAAVELEVPKEKFAKAMDYLKENAKTFEDVRIGAAAVEAWGVKDCPFDLKPWFTIAEKHIDGVGSTPAKDGGARDTASYSAMLVRLGKPLPAGHKVGQILSSGQRADGGFGKTKSDSSDLETTYRVMRAFYLLKEKPADVAKIRAFVAACRNADGGYGVKPGELSTAGGVYYAAIITRWLDGLEKEVR
ncbi:MAG: hypothetical protein JWO38_690 [Gemmataceae bacterium]|nr:hypothetical protein [Gemmataceae bacterium]